MPKPSRSVKPGQPSSGVHDTAPRASRTAMLNEAGPCIYAARTSDGLIKIGWSGQMGRRIASLGGGYRSILALRFGATRADESALHDSLTGHAVRGREWYAPTPEVLAVVNEMRRNNGLAEIAS